MDLVLGQILRSLLLKPIEELHHLGVAVLDGRVGCGWLVNLVDMNTEIDYITGYVTTFLSMASQGSESTRPSISPGQLGCSSREVQSQPQRKDLR